MFEHYQQYLKESAYHYWKLDGCPNGEEYVETLLGPMKIKDIHWIKAEISLQEDLEIFKWLDVVVVNGDELEHSQE